MAQRRMFNLNLVSSDDFCDLPHSAQTLYLHLNLSADDDGIVGNPERLMRSLKIQKRHLTLLMDKGYILRFDSGVVAIRHWCLHNQIRKDRRVKSRYQTELSKLKINNEDAYDILENTEENGILCQPNDGENAPQYSIVEDSIVKESIGEESIGKKSVDKESEEKNSLEKLRSVLDSLEKNSIEKSRIEEGDAGKGHFDFEPMPECIDNIRTFAEAAVANITPLCRKYMDTLNDKDREKYNDFLFNLSVFILTKHRRVDYTDFVRYNEERGWIGQNGESVITNFRKYVEIWEANDPKAHKRRY